MKVRKINYNVSIKNAREIKIGSTYRHYSGKLYKVIALARDTEDISILRVVYQALYKDPQFGSNALWVRPYNMFAQDVIIKGKAQPRFQEIDIEVNK